MLIPSNSYLLNRENFNILHVITWLLYIPLYILPKQFLLENISSFIKISLIGNKVVFYFNFLNFFTFWNIFYSKSFNMNVVLLLNSSIIFSSTLST